MKWLMLLALLPTHAHAVKTVMEGVQTSNNTVYVDTVNVRFGIGLSTAGSKIDVNGDAAIRGPLTVAGSSATIGGALRATTLSAGTDLNSTFGSIMAAHGGADLNLDIRNASGIMVLESQNDSGGAYTPMKIDSSNLILQKGSGGSVGIGVTSPQTTLEVNGSAQFGSGATKSTFTAAGFLTTIGLNSTSSTTFSGGVFGQTTIMAGSTITINSIAPLSVSTPIANSIYNQLLNQAYVIFVTSGAAAQVLYSVGVTSVTYISQGSYVVNWQNSFTTPYYFVHITAQDARGTVRSCIVDDEGGKDLNTRMVSIACANQSPAVQNPAKVMVMATGPQ